VKMSDDSEVTRKSKDSANRTMTMLKAALNLAYKNGLVATDSAWRRVDRFPAAGKARDLFLTDAQVGELVGATRGGFRDLVEVAIHTGARYGELASATCAAFDAHDGTLRLSGKTGARTVYLSDGAVRVLKRVTRDKLPAAPLLMQDGGKGWIKGSYRKQLRNAMRTAKLPAETVFYSLRHYHISKALLAGVNAQVIAENVGTSVVMIEKHYGKFMKADRRAMFNRVELGV
jgi:integrase